MAIMASLKVCIVAILWNAFQMCAFLYEKPHPCLVNCTSRLMSEIFKDSVVVYVVLEDDINSVLPNLTGNSYILVDPFNNITKTELSYGGVNWLIQAKSEKSLASILDGLNSSNVWHRTISPGGKFLITLPTTNASAVFLTLWKYEILDSVVITFDNDSATYHTFNPHINENNCGRKATMIESRGCVQEIAIRFGNDIRNFGKCRICITLEAVEKHEDPYDFQNHISAYVHFQIVLAALHFHIGLTLESCYINCTYNKLKNYDMAIKFMRVETDDYNKYLDTTVGEPFSDFFWIFPPRKEIPKIKLLGYIFQIETWIVIVILLLLKAVCWWFFLLSENTQSKLKKCFVTFTDIVALLLGGGVNRVPNITALKWLLVIYLFYFIHIHVAFTANFYDLLTVPKYEDPIKSVEDLANSNINICLYRDYQSYFLADEPLDSIYSKIKRKISYNDDDFFVMFNRTMVSRECATLVTDFMAVAVQYHSKKQIDLLNDDLLGKHDLFAFKFLKGPYMMRTFNRLITILRESGIFLHRQHIFTSFYKNFLQRNIVSEEDVSPLNLEQTYFCFVIFGVGCCFATFVFLLELAIYHFQKWYK